MTDPITPCIIILLDTYLPGYRGGGPITTIANVVQRLGQEFNFHIITRDRDLGDRAPYLNVTTDTWLKIGNAQVCYITLGIGGMLKLMRHLQNANAGSVLYLNSFFSVPFSIFPIILKWAGLCRIRNVLLAPRGEFTLGALSIHSARKSLYLALVGMLGLYRGIVWQASTEMEMQDIGRRLNAGLAVDSLQQVRIAKDIASIPDVLLDTEPISQARCEKISGKLRVIYLARITVMKNLISAISYFQAVRGEVEFAIYGPVEDHEYWEKCKDAIRSLPTNVRATYQGLVKPSQVHTLLSKYDLLLLPSFGENFGHVISESLMAGCPVLTSDQTPWQNLEEHGVGWTVSLSEPERFQVILQQCIDSNEDEYKAMAQRIEKYRQILLCDTAAIDANRDLFRFASIPQTIQKG